MAGVTFQAAVNAYNNATSLKGIAGGVQDNIAANNSSEIFSQMMGSSISNIYNSVKKAESVSTKALVKQADITDVVNAITSAEITLKTVVAIRDRMIAAYQEISRMPI